MGTVSWPIRRPAPFETDRTTHRRLRAAVLAGLEQLALGLERLLALTEGGAVVGGRRGLCGRLHRHHRAGDDGVCGEGGLAGAKAVEHRHLRIDVAHRHAGDVAVAVADRGAVRAPLGRRTRHEVEIAVGLGAVVHAAAILDRIRAGRDEGVLGLRAGGGDLVGASLVVAAGLVGHALALGRLDLAGELPRLFGGQVLAGDLDAAVAADDERHAVLAGRDLGGIGRLVRDRGGHDRDVDGGLLGTGRGDEGRQDEGQEHERPLARETDPLRHRRVNRTMYTSFEGI